MKNSTRKTAPRPTQPQDRPARSGTTHTLARNPHLCLRSAAAAREIRLWVVLALICWFAIGELNHSGGRAAFVAAYGLVPVVILSLLLVSAQAVTAITTERDGNSLDLLLVTDLSPREFIFGKLGGILWNTKEFLIPLYC